MKRKTKAAIASFCVVPLLFVLFQNFTPTNSALGEPTIEDLFSGKARFQTLSESQKIQFHFAENHVINWDPKVAFFKNPSSTGHKYFAFVRGTYTLPALVHPFAEKNNIFLMASDDGITYGQYGPAIFERFKANFTVYDPHLSIDSGSSPERYILTFECEKIKADGSFEFGASVCISESTQPLVAASWSEPRVIVRNEGYKSASTGVTLVDEDKLYLKWTIVDDGIRSSGGSLGPDEGYESASSWAAEIFGTSTYMGRSSQIGKLIMGADQNTRCTSSWDCNNRDIHDWKKINSKYYAIYNGGNYYRCTRPDAERAAGLTNNWGLAIRRSNAALGDYSESTGIVIGTHRNDTCAISYPTLEVIDGVTYLFYAHSAEVAADPNAKINHSYRSKLVWGTRPAATHAPMSSQPQFDKKPIGEIGPFIKRLYSEFLGRVPSDSEVGWWINHTTSQLNKSKDLPTGIFFSLEAQNRRYMRSLDLVVTDLYRGLLTREPAIEEVSNWSGSGIPLGNIWHYFINSSEYRTYQLYSEVLDRRIDGEGFTNVRNYLENSGSESELRQTVSQSAEARALVNNLYIEVLGRSVDPEGLQSVLTALGAGYSISDIRYNLATSQEARNILNSVHQQYFQVPAAHENIQRSLLSLAHRGSLGDAIQNMADTTRLTQTRQGRSRVIGYINDVYSRPTTHFVWGWACTENNPRQMNINVYRGQSSASILVASGKTGIEAEVGVQSLCKSKGFNLLRFNVEIPNSTLDPSNVANTIFVEAVDPVTEKKLMLLKVKPVSLTFITPPRRTPANVDELKKSISELLKKRYGRNGSAGEIAKLVQTMIDAELSLKQVDSLIATSAPALRFKAIADRNWVYRLQLPSNNVYLITTNPSEGLRSGYKYQGAIFQIYNSGSPARKAIFSCKMNGQNTQFLSTRSDCEGHFVDRNIGYLPQAATPTETLPVYRCFKSSHLHTTDQNECDTGGFKFKTILGYTQSMNSFMKAPNLVYLQNEKKIKKMYLDHFGRDATAWEASVWMSRLTQGQLNLVQIENILSTSPASLLFKGNSDRIWVYKLSQPVNQSYYYTTKPTEALRIGYRYESTAFQIYRKTAKDRQQVSICQFSTSKSYFLSTAMDCEGQTIVTRIGYLSKIATATDRIPIYRCSKDHTFYTTDQQECSAAGFTNQGVLGYTQQ